MLMCVSCGRDNPEDARFCNGCGAALATAAPPREVRKTVTVLFCDVAGSTALGESTDPETRAVELLRPHRLELALELELALATAEVDGRAAVQAADTVAECAAAAGDPAGAMLARAQSLLLRMISGDLSATDAPEKLCRTALPVEEERADPRRLALLWFVIASSAQSRMRNDESVAAFERALGTSR